MSRSHNRFTTRSGLQISANSSPETNPLGGSSGNEQLSNDGATSSSSFLQSDQMAGNSSQNLSVVFHSLPSSEILIPNLNTNVNRVHQTSGNIPHDVLHDSINTLVQQTSHDVLPDLNLKPHLWIEHGQNIQSVVIFMSKQLFNFNANLFDAKYTEIMQNSAIEEKLHNIEDMEQMVNLFFRRFLWKINFTMAVNRAFDILGPVPKIPDYKSKHFTL